MATLENNSLYLWRWGGDRRDPPPTLLLLLLFFLTAYTYTTGACACCLASQHKKKMSLTSYVALACLVACVPRLGTGAPLDDLSLTFGDEAIPFAGVSSLICPEDTRIACINLGRYIRFAVKHKKPEVFGWIWAFESLLGGPCISLEQYERCDNASIAYGICTSCEVCTTAGLGWCDKAHLAQVAPVDNSSAPDVAFAPLCFDTNHVNGCPYSSAEPVLAPEGCPELG